MELAANPPFDFSKSLSFMCSFPPTRGEQHVEGAGFTKAFARKNKAIVARVRGEGDRLITDTEDPEIAALLRFQLGLDDDVAGFYALAKQDRAFRPLVERLYGLHHVKFGSGPFEAACWAVLCQRVRIPIARATKDRLVKALGPRSGEHRAFPEPGALVEAGVDRLRELVGDRAAPIVEIARAFEDVDDRFLRSAPMADVEAWLRALPRIGEWSAAFVLFRALGRMERIPGHVDPLARAAQQIYGGTEKQALARGEAYGEHLGYWSYYLRAGVG
ncbi:MAG: DNA-3-methyladenine glycosylase family protein [Polyangiales bacterium]